MKVVISVILILVVAVYEQILSSTEQGFIGLLIGNQTSMFKLGGGSVIFVPKGGGGSCVFYQPRFQMLPRKLVSVTVSRCHYKGSTSSQAFKHFGPAGI